MKRNYNPLYGECCCIYCKKVFYNITAQGLLAHRQHCIPYRKLVNKPNPDYSHLDEARKWLKPGHPKYEEHLEKLKRTSREGVIKKYGSEKNLCCHISCFRTKDTFKKQSDTRKRKYREGTLTPAKGVGRGKYSYFIYDNKKILLRSTYEFIFALFLFHLGKEINYEDIRVQWKGSTRISDFRLKNKIYEIKGFDGGGHVSEIVEAFENNGYNIKLVYYSTIERIRKYLTRKGYPVNYFINKIIEKHNNREYFVFVGQKQGGWWNWKTHGI